MSTRKWRTLGILVFLLVLGISSVLWVRSELDRSMDASRVPVLLNDLTQLKTAVNAYRAEYGINPPADPKQLLRILQGENVNGLNSRGIVFADLSRITLHNSWFYTSYGLLNGAGELIDVWGRPYIWESANPNQLTVWTQGRTGKMTREEAKAKGWYRVLLSPTGQSN